MLDNTLSETRRAMTLRNADKIPAKMGISISFKPNTCSVWSLESKPSFRGSLKLKVYNIFLI